jgi:hypothetical protein
LDAAIIGLARARASGHRRQTRRVELLAPLAAELTAWKLASGRRGQTTLEVA